MKKLLAKMDLPLLLLMFVFCILGCVMVFSASSISAVLRYHVSPYYFFFRQAIIMVVMIIIGLILIIRVPTSKYKLFAPFLLLGILAALVGLFVYGYISNGAQSWYDLGFFSFQPSEFAKSILIIFMAVYYDRYSKIKKSNPLSSVIPLGVGLAMAILVAMQPDLGGAIIILGLCYLIFLAAPIGKVIKSKVTLTIMGGLVLVLATLLISGGSILQEHQLNRLEFRNPCQRYLESTGYQVCNGFIAFHNGGLFGVGLGNSTQKYLYLPEAHTDFIFPIIVEELGLVVSFLILIGYIIMLIRILSIARHASNIRNSILAYGTFILLLSHILVNLLGVLALIPLTGVPLPFLSYGGSFSINIITMLFVCERVAIENKKAQSDKELAKL